MKKESSRSGFFLAILFLCFVITLPARMIGLGMNPCRYTFSVFGKDSTKKIQNKNYFRSWGVTPAMEFMTTKAKLVTIRYQPVGYSYYSNYRDTTTYGETSGGTTLVSFTYEFRYNLYHYIDKASVSTSIPIAGSLNIFEREGRMFSFTLPVFFDANYGMHSTYNNIDRIGGHIGVGYQVVFAGLIREAGYHNGKGSTWTQPVFRAGGKFPFHKRNCFFDMYWGLGKTYKAFGGYSPYNGEPLYGKVLSKLYFKIVFGWLIHYD